MAQATARAVEEMTGRSQEFMPEVSYLEILTQRMVEHALRRCHAFWQSPGRDSAASAVTVKIGVTMATLKTVLATAATGAVLAVGA